MREVEDLEIARAGFAGFAGWGWGGFAEEAVFEGPSREWGGVVEGC